MSGQLPSSFACVRVTLPQHLRTLAQVTGEVQLEVPAPVTIDGIVGALEMKFPQLTGTIRDHSTRKRRPFIRFFALEEDLSNEPTDVPVPAAIAAGVAPLQIVGAIAGG